MNFGSFDEIISFAIEKEQEAADFYEEVAGKESFSAIKESLLSFAIEEKKHKALLEDFDKNREKLESYEFKKVTDLKRSDYMVDLVYEPDMTYVDILRLAMKREEKAFKLYSRLSVETENQEYIKLFNILAQEESKHKNFLETVYDDHMAGQGD